jgi:toxin ParE1/3/4
MKKPKLTVRLLRVAEDDLVSIISYVASGRKSAAIELAAMFESRLQMLATNPRLGLIPKEPQLKKLGFRYLLVEDYLVFYTVEGSTLLVHRVIHGARDYLPLF